MAEQVQAILERMVPLLKDLRSRGLFSPDEIRSIVDRRRQSEYLLQRRSAARKSDYLRYIEEEILLERLRKLRKEKVLTDMRNERIRRLQEKDGSDGDDSDGDRGRKHAYQISGPGDSHILSHVHFLYQRTLKKFHYPLDVLLNYAQFAKDYKSFHMLSRIYAEGLQHHPREAGLWIEAASFEYFGYVAQDYENASKGGTDSDNVNSKVVGSSIQNARVLMQRGLRINKSSAELWLQYFALELHYVQKLRGRKEILKQVRARQCWRLPLVLQHGAILRSGLDHQGRPGLVRQRTGPSPLRKQPALRLLQGEQKGPCKHVAYQFREESTMEVGDDDVRGVEGSSVGPPLCVVQRIGVPVDAQH